MLTCPLPRAFCAVCLEFVCFPAVHHVPPCWKYWRVSRGKKRKKQTPLLSSGADCSLFYQLYTLLKFLYNIKIQYVISLRSAWLKCCRHIKALKRSCFISLCTDCLCPVWLEVKTLPHHLSQCCCVCFGGGKTHTWTHGVTADVFLMFSFCFFHAVCSSLSHLAGQQDQSCDVRRNYVVMWKCFLSSKRQITVSVIISTLSNCFEHFFVKSMHLWGFWNSSKQYCLF